MKGYNIFLIIISLISSGYIIVLVRNSRLHIMQMFWWLFVIISVLIFGIFPRLVDLIGHFLGVQYPPIIVLVVALIFILVKMIKMDKYITENEIRSKELVQKIAILEAELDKYGGKNEKEQN